MKEAYNTVCFFFILYFFNKNNFLNINHYKGGFIYGFNKKSYG